MAEIQKFSSRKPSTRRRYIPEAFKKKKFFKKDTQENDKVKQLRSSKRWQSLREMFLRRYPLCCFCGHAANEVHHIELAIDHPDKFYDMSNLAALCVECHAKVHSAYRRGITPDSLFPENKRHNEEVE